jgi:hypothetical protein
MRRPLPVFPDKQTFSQADGMSQTCQQETHALQQFNSLFDHLVGAQDEVRRDLDADFLRGFQVDDKLELARLFDRNVGRTSPAQHLGKLAAQQAKPVINGRPVADQAALFGHFGLFAERAVVLFSRHARKQDKKLSVHRQRQRDIGQSGERLGKQEEIRRTGLRASSRSYIPV